MRTKKVGHERVTNHMKAKLSLTNIILFHGHAAALRFETHCEAAPSVSPRNNFLNTASMEVCLSLSGTSTIN